MALNKAVFKTRALTAIAFAIVMLGGILWNANSFLVLLTVIHFGCWFEYLKLIEKMYKTQFSFFYTASLMCGSFAVMLSFFFFKYISPGTGIWNFFIPVFGIASFVLLVYNFILLKGTIFSKKSFAALAGVAYISFPAGMLIGIYFTGFFPRPGGCGVTLAAYTILFIILSIWINDTMAYIVGSFIGKTPLSKISPKKTWEGTAGGSILSVVVMSAAGYFIWPFKSVPLYHLPIIAALCAVFGTLGDLLESKLKRLADVKDSGNFMPGHGGFLDRFDSLLLAAPAVWIYFQLITAFSS